MKSLLSVVWIRTPLKPHFFLQVSIGFHLFNFVLVNVVLIEFADDPSVVQTKFMVIASIDLLRTDYSSLSLNVCYNQFETSEYIRSMRI